MRAVYTTAFSVAIAASGVDADQENTPVIPISRTPALLHSAGAFYGVDTAAGSRLLLIDNAVLTVNFFSDIEGNNLVGAISLSSGFPAPAWPVSFSGGAGFGVLLPRALVIPTDINFNGKRAGGWQVVLSTDARNSDVVNPHTLAINFYADMDY